MAYQPIEPVGLGRNVSAEMMKGGPRLQEEIKTMGPNTIKMIALQQIADQQKQKASQANLQAQTNPATVVQQLEQQLGGMGQPQQSMGLPPMRDKAQQVGGALAQKQQQQQKNMQRAAQSPQQGRPPMMAGGGLLSRPAPNIDPRYFEGGGIVAFAEGGGVSSEELKEMGLTYEQFAKLSSKQQEAVAKQINFERRQKQDLSRLDRVASGTLDIATAPIVAGANVLEMARTSGIGKSLGLADPEEEARHTPYMQFIDRAKATDAANAGRTSQEGILSQIKKDMGGESVRTGIDTLTKELQGQFDENIGGPSKDPLTPYSGPKVPKPVGQSAPEEVEVVEEVVKPRPAIPKITSTGIDTPKSLKDAGQRPDREAITKGLGALKTAGVDEEAAARTDYKKQMRLSPELNEERNEMARRTKEREENYKPSRATTIREALAGAANRGSLGSVGAGISGAMSAREGDIQKRKDSLFKARQDSLDKLVMRSDDIAKGAVTFGADARKGFKEDARTLVDVEARMYATESADARQARQQEADIAIANAGQQFTAQVENARNTLKAQSDADLAGYRKESNVIAREGNTQRATKDRNTLINNINKGKAKTQADIAAVIAERAAALDSVEAKIPSSVEEDDPEAVAEWKEGILSAMAKTYAPMLDAYDAQLKDLGIDVPEPAAPTEPKASPTFASLPK